MATFDTLIDDLATRYGLGANARSLVKEVLTMISSSPGGLAGFLGMFKKAGLSSEVTSWLGRPDAGPIAAGQVERALGATALSGIEGRLGLAHGALATALGYAVPKIVGLLTPGGAVPAGVPAAVTAFLSQPTERAPGRGPGASPASAPAPNQSGVGRWLWPALGALVVAGYLAYFWSNRTPSAPPLANAPQPEAPAPPAVAQAPSPPPAHSEAAQPPAPPPPATPCAGAAPCSRSFDGRASFASAASCAARRTGFGPDGCTGACDLGSRGRRNG